MLPTLPSLSVTSLMRNHLSVLLLPLFPMHQSPLSLRTFSEPCVNDNNSKNHTKNDDFYSWSPLVYRCLSRLLQRCITWCGVFQSFPNSFFSLLFVIIPLRHKLFSSKCGKVFLRKNFVREKHWSFLFAFFSSRCSWNIQESFKWWFDYSPLLR